LIPSISTNIATLPWELVIVQGGPGETHPGGVGPGVSHLLFGLPGLKRLFVRDPDPVTLSVMSVILTIHGEEHGTRGFQEPDPIGNWGTLAFPG